MKTHFILRGTKKEEKVITLFISNNKAKNLKYSLKIKINPSFWDNGKERIKNTAKLLYKNNINDYLNDIEQQVNDFVLYKIQPSLEDIKCFLDSYLKQQNTKDEPTTFKDYVYKYVDSSKTRKSITTGEPLTKNTIQKFNYIKNSLNEYFNNKEYDFNDIDMNFYNRFISFLEKKNLHKNTIGKIIRALKTILIAAEKDGYAINKEFHKREFKILEEEVYNIYLTEQEIKKIEEFEIKDEYLNNIRNLFILECYTGLRYSDVIRLDVNNIQNGLIRIRQQKTGKDVIVPILYDNVEELIKNKINIANVQTINRDIKKICKAMGEFDEQIIKYSTIGGKRIKTNYCKYELITSHTARRSFITNIYKKNIVPTISLMKISGHHTEKAFLKYIKISDEENATMIQDLFNKQKELVK